MQQKLFNIFEKQLWLISTNYVLSNYTISNVQILNPINIFFQYSICCYPYFRVFDRSGDGYISKTEFKHCMMHFGEQFTDEEVEEMIAEADKNNDGKLDYEEFTKMILNEIG